MKDSPTALRAAAVALAPTGPFTKRQIVDQVLGEKSTVLERKKLGDCFVSMVARGDFAKMSEFSGGHGRPTGMYLPTNRVVSRAAVDRSRWPYPIPDLCTFFGITLPENFHVRQYPNALQYLRWED